MPWSPKKQHVSPTYCGSIFSLYLCFQLPTLIAGAFKIQGPHEPVVALVGDEAELPCFLLPHQRASHMQIHWSSFPSSEVVHLFKAGWGHPGEAMKEYSGRTTLVRDAIYKGIVVLRILNVRPSDNGQYHYGFRHGSFYSDTLIELKVAGQERPASLLLRDHSKKNVTCSVWNFVLNQKKGERLSIAVAESSSYSLCTPLMALAATVIPLTLIITGL